MQESMQDRTMLLLGEQAVDNLSRCHVLVVGLGGVGGTAAEALCRSGIGKLTLVDGDVVACSNLNRQVVASQSTLGQSKAMAMAKKLQDINPMATLTAIKEHFTERSWQSVLSVHPDFIVDAIDTMSDKLLLIEMAHTLGIPMISATGAGNRLDLQKLKLADIFETSGDPVCRILRRELKKKGIARHQVVYSQEEPLRKGRPTGSMMFVPSAMGLLMAQYAVEQLKGRDAT